MHFAATTNDCLCKCFFSQVRLILRSGDVQRFGLCWHNLPGNNPLMCSMNLHEAVFFGGGGGLLLTYKQVCTTGLCARPMPLGLNQVLYVCFRTPPSISPCPLALPREIKSPPSSTYLSIASQLPAFVLWRYLFVSSLLHPALVSCLRSLCRTNWW